MKRTLIITDYEYYSCKTNIEEYILSRFREAEIDPDKPFTMHYDMTNCWTVYTQELPF